MDPAQEIPTVVRLAHIEEYLHQHRELKDTIAVRVVRAANTFMLNSLDSEQLSIPTPPPAPALVSPSATPTNSPEPLVGTPVRFAGDPAECGAFITKCTLLFTLQPRSFAFQAAKVGGAEE